MRGSTQKPDEQKMIRARSSSSALARGLLCVGFLVMSEAHAEGEAGAKLFDVHCAACHTGADTQAGPHLAAMRQMSASQIRFAMTRGKMREQSKGLSRNELWTLLGFITGESTASGYQPPATALCSKNAADIDLRRVPVPSWGVTPRNSRYQADTTITPANVGTLELAWAFGLPQTTDARSHPVVTGDTVFVLAVSGRVFALDRASGCIRWQFESAAPLRSPITLGISQSEPVLYFADFETNVHAVSARTGQLVWKTRVGLFDASTVTGGSVQHGDTLFVPVSAFGVALAANPQYECCKSHGAVRALDARTGEIRWTTRMADPAQPTYKNSVGVQQWGPSGVPVWTTPTIDVERQRIYVGTGENTSTPATELSDAIIALDMKTGAIEWVFQATRDDAYNNACGFRRGPNCPKEDGPDFDFGAAPVLADLPRGGQILVAGQKSGTVHALNPENGDVVWQTVLSQGTALGGVHWGISVAGDRVIVPVSDPEWPLPNYVPKPGIYALDIADGRVLWAHKAQRGCKVEGEWFAPSEPWPACSFYYGFSAAASTAAGLAFAGSLDGTAYAFDIGNGQVLWEYPTVRSFDSVNGVITHGGAIDNPGMQIADDMLFLQSGYSMFAQMPGNALLAFKLPHTSSP